MPRPTMGATYVASSVGRTQAMPFAAFVGAGASAADSDGSRW